MMLGSPLPRTSGTFLRTVLGASLRPLLGVLLGLSLTLSAGANAVLWARPPGWSLSLGIGSPPGGGLRSGPLFGSLFGSSFGSSFGSCWRATELQLQIRRFQRELQQVLDETRKPGRFDQPPQLNFPPWSRCQTLALRSRHDVLLVKMNLAGVKAAQTLLSRRSGYDHDRLDRLEEGLPPGFSAEDRGRSILRDLRFHGGHPTHIKALLRHEQQALRTLLTDLRDEINRDVVWAYHQWEGKRRDGSPQEQARAAWFLYLTMGWPRRLDY